MFTHRAFFSSLMALFLAIFYSSLTYSAESSSDSQSIQERYEVNIGYTPLIYAQPMFVAVEKGFFQEVGITAKLTKFENSTQVVNAVIEGGLDFCAITPVLSVFAAEEKLSGKGKDTLFKLYYYNLDSTKDPISFIIVPKSSEINSLSDLKGKTIGVFPGNLLSKVSAKLLLKKYMNPDKDVVFQDVAPNLQAQALETKQIDAMFSLEPFATITMEKGIGRILHIAPQTSISDPLPGGAGMMSTKFITENPTVAKKFEESIQKATDYLRANPEYAKEVLTKYTPLTKDLADKVRQPLYETPREMNAALLQKEYNVLLKEGVFRKKFDTKKLIYGQH